jgi:hypothetical protein
MENTYAGSASKGARRPYVKPFLRNLDVMDTEGKPGYPVEQPFTFGGDLPRS